MSGKLKDIKIVIFLFFKRMEWVLPMGERTDGQQGKENQGWHGNCSIFPHLGGGILHIIPSSPLLQLMLLPIINYNDIMRNYFLNNYSEFMCSSWELHRTSTFWGFNFWSMVKKLSQKWKDYCLCWAKYLVKLMGKEDRTIEYWLAKGKASK